MGIKLPIIKILVVTPFKYLTMIITSILHLLYDFQDILYYLLTYSNITVNLQVAWGCYKYPLAEETIGTLIIQE